MQVAVMSGNTPPLARQNASFGSVDFLKLLETGPNGEPLTFAEVLENNPDWAEQNADPLVVQANLQPPAQPLDSSRNPGGGAEPPAASSALLEEAVRLTGGEGEPSQDLFRNLPPLGNTLLGSGFSGNFSQLVRHPSFSSQLSKDPSFGTAVFQSLLSHKSEDQAMLWQFLGVDPITGNSQLATSSAKDTLLPISTLNTNPTRPEAKKDPGGLTPIPQLPNSGIHLDGSIKPDQSLRPTPQLQSSLPPVTSSTALLMGGLQSQANTRVPAWPPPELAARLPPPLPRGAELRQAMDPMPSSMNMGGLSARPADMETRAASLDYLLQGGPHGGNKPAGIPSNQQNWLDTGQKPTSVRPEIAVQIGGSGYRLPSGSARLDSSGFQPVPKRPEREHPGGALPPINPPRPFAPRASYPSQPWQAPQLPLRNGDAGQLSAKIPPNFAQQAPRLPPLALEGSALGAESPAVGTLRPTPMTQAMPLMPPARTSFPGTSHAQPSKNVRLGNAAAAAHAKQKSTFVSGLMKGISPLVKKEFPEASKGPQSTVPASIKLPPLPALPQLKPLPPPPKLQTIEQYQRSLAPTTLKPQLGILPLQGLPAQGRWAGSGFPEAAPSLPSSGQMASQLAPFDGRMMPQNGSHPGFTSPTFQPHMPELPPRPNSGGAMAMPPISNMRVAKLRTNSQTKPGGSMDSRSQRKRGRLDDISSNADASTSHGDVAMDSDAEAEGKKELRKAKNRASAAASRARREAYTASLEAEVMKLQRMQTLYRQMLNDKSRPREPSKGATLSRQKSI